MSFLDETAPRLFPKFKIRVNIETGPPPRVLECCAIFPLEPRVGEKTVSIDPFAI